MVVTLGQHYHVGEKPTVIVYAYYIINRHVWSSHIIARVRINRVRLPILLVVSQTGKMIFSLSVFAPENLVSRDGFGSPVPHQPAHLHNTQAESGAYLRGSSRFAGTPKKTKTKDTMSLDYSSSVCNTVVVSYTQRIGYQPKITTLLGDQSRSWPAEQGKDNKKRKSGSTPPPPQRCSYGGNKMKINKNKKHVARTTKRPKRKQCT